MRSKLPKDQIEKNFAEINPRMSKAEAKFEANRCLFCYDAPCTRACPTHIDVPSFIKKIATDNLKGSARVIFDANPIGATCARVCPVEALCEGACVEKTLMDKPIEIGRLQRYATDTVTENGNHIFEAGEPNGLSVGIVGTGPAGLSCATYLARLGYKVTMYEKKALAGGLDTYGMAEYKMSQKVALDEVRLVEELGVEIRVSTAVHGGRSQESEVRSQADESARSSDPSPPSSDDLHHSLPITHHSSLSTQHSVLFDRLVEAHDAVFLGIGLGATNKLKIQGENLDGVFDALWFIEQIKTRDWHGVHLGDTVAVIGAGNTAIDAVTQAKRLGAAKVMMIYRRSEDDISAYDYEYELAKKDGIDFFWHSSPVEILGDEKVEGLRCLLNDGSDEVFDIRCDMVVKAIGQEKQKSFFDSVGIATDEKGRVAVDESRMTSREKVFAGGDCVNGGKEAVDASQAGKLAAMGIHEKLTGKTVSFAGA
jgi:glutamate synthase (NADPH/NADH) small chain